MSMKRQYIAIHKASVKRMIADLEFSLGVETASPAVNKLLEVLAALERIDNELVEAK